jgi:acetyl-CoA carboxylase biotin carboxyl carrier protein
MSEEPRNAAASKKAAEAAGGTMAAETASLLGLIDRLTDLLEKSDLVELEVEAGTTGLVLRKPAALATQVSGVNLTVAGADSSAAAPAAPVAPTEPPAPTVKAVVAPLTGIFYGSSSPAAPAYTAVGQHVEVGQVIGLIEAMKLFNEIKSDKAGRVVRVVAESGKLVKAKSPLIEVEP